MSGNTSYELAHLIAHGTYKEGTIMSPVLKTGQLYVREVK